MSENITGIMSRKGADHSIPELGYVVFCTHTQNGEQSRNVIYCVCKVTAGKSMSSLEAEPGDNAPPVMKRLQKM